MDELVEFLLELLFEIPIDAAMESKRLKTGVKTAVFSVLGGSLTALFGFITVCKWMEGDDPTGSFFMALITLGLLGLVIFGAIRGHRRKWRNE